MRKYLINAESYQEILEAEKATKSKKVSKKVEHSFDSFRWQNHFGNGKADELLRIKSETHRG